MTNSFHHERHNKWASIYFGLRKIQGHFDENPTRFRMIAGLCRFAKAQMVAHGRQLWPKGYD
jgi:hypothetical protein